MIHQEQLPLYEEILLLALDDAQGTTPTGSMFANAMGGAMLAELAMDGLVKISDDKHKRITLVSGTIPSDPILAECVALVAGTKKPKKASDWVLKFGSLKDLKNRTARHLVVKGVLKEDTGTVLRIFKRTIYPEIDGGPERHLMGRLEQAIFTETPEVDQRTLVIVALARATNMLPTIFDKKKLKARKERLEQLSSGQMAGAATREAVEAMQAAIFVCTIVPAITAATH